MACIAVPLLSVPCTRIQRVGMACALPRVPLTPRGCMRVVLCQRNRDTRLGVQHTTVATDFKKVFQLNDRLFLGLAGLATDVQTVYVALHRYVVACIVFAANDGGPCTGMSS